MKKLISSISALLTAAMLIARMSAFADTTINPDPDDMPNPKPPMANTTVEFSVDPTYTVTIPAKVELAEDEDLGAYTGKGTLIAEDVFLEPNQTMVVTISGDFVLENEADNSVTLGYQAEGSYGAINSQNSGGRVTTFKTSEEPQTFDVDFSTVQDPKYAGVYSDTVTFGISIETRS